MKAAAIFFIIALLCRMERHWKLIPNDWWTFLLPEDQPFPGAPDPDILMATGSQHCHGRLGSGQAHAVGGEAGEKARGGVFMRNGKRKRRRLGLYSASRTPSGYC